MYCRQRYADKQADGQPGRHRTAEMCSYGVPATYMPVLGRWRSSHAGHLAISYGYFNYTFVNLERRRLRAVVGGTLPTT